MDKLQGTDQKQPEKFLVSDRISKVGDGWLTPNGDFYKCSSKEHDIVADYLVKSTEFNTIKNEKQIEFEDEDSGRKQIEELGYVLLRDNTWHSIDGISLTSEQLSKMGKARTVIIRAFDGSKEYSQISLNIADEIKKSPTYLKAEENLKTWGEGFAHWEKGTIADVEKFANDPFKTEIHTESVIFDEDEIAEKQGEKSLPVEIFDILSQGYYEEMKAFNGRYKYTFRVVDIGNGEKMMIQKVKYNHDGLSGGEHGAVENWINLFVVDDKTIAKAIEKKIQQKGTTDIGERKVVLQDMYGYFAGLLDRTSSSFNSKFPLSIVT